LLGEAVVAPSIRNRPCLFRELMFSTLNAKQANLERQPPAHAIPATRNRMLAELRALWNTRKTLLRSLLADGLKATLPPKTKPTLIHETGSYSVLGVRVNALQIPGVVSRMEYWIARRRKCHYVAVTNMHSLMRAQHSTGFKKVLCDADLLLPDGFPLVWLGRRNGFALRRRVYGFKLMEQFCQATLAKGYRHFFYGGVSGALPDLATRFTRRFPGSQLAGALAPPLRPLTPEEDRAVVAAINASQPDVIWVCLGAPREERWMFEHRHLLEAPVLVGAGTALDFHTESVAQAPLLSRISRFEWFFRLISEPRRLWHRYLLCGAQFLGLVCLEAFGFRKFR
jgi:N-acetylglucosaminyldiphosphoundecaprenol N-acetyl-beta-D-mannosaminyltransferase